MTTCLVTATFEFSNSGKVFGIIGLPEEASKLINGFLGWDFNDPNLHREDIVLYPLTCLCRLFSGPGVKQFRHKQERTYEIKLG